MKLVILYIAFWASSAFAVNLTTAVDTIDDVLSARDAFGILQSNACHLSNIRTHSNHMCTAAQLPANNSQEIFQALRRACPDLNFAKYRNIQAISDEYRRRYGARGRRMKFYNDIRRGIRGVISRRGVNLTARYVARIMGNYDDLSSSELTYLTNALNDLNTNTPEEIIDNADSNDGLPNSISLLNSLADAFLTGNTDGSDTPDLDTARSDSTINHKRSRCHARARIPSSMEAITGAPSTIPSNGICNWLAVAYKNQDEMSDGGDPVYSSQNLARADAILERVKSRFNSMIDNIPCISETERSAMRQRVATTTIKRQRIDASHRVTTSDHANCGITGSGSNRHNVIHLSPYYMSLIAHGNVGLVESTISHELSHAMDGAMRGDAVMFAEYNRSCSEYGNTSLGQCLDTSWHFNSYRRPVGSGSITSGQRRVLRRESYADNYSNIYLNQQVQSGQLHISAIQQRVCHYAAMSNGHIRTAGAHQLGTDRAHHLLNMPAIRRRLGCPYSQQNSEGPVCMYNQ